MIKISSKIIILLITYANTVYNTATSQINASLTHSDIENIENVIYDSMHDPQLKLLSNLSKRYTVNTEKYKGLIGSYMTFARIAVWYSIKYTDRWNQNNRSGIRTNDPFFNIEMQEFLSENQSAITLMNKLSVQWSSLKSDNPIRGDNTFETMGYNISVALGNLKVLKSKTENRSVAKIDTLLKFASNYKKVFDSFNFKADTLIPKLSSELQIFFDHNTI